MNNHLTNKSYSRHGTHDLRIKNEYLEYIFKCVQDNKSNKEILNELQEKYGSECIPKNTLNQWIAALKTRNEEYARDKLGPDFMTYWDELKRLNYAANSRKPHEPSVKRAYIQFICECMKQKKNDCEIVKALHDKYGSECISKHTLLKWIIALKTKNKMFAREKLGSDLMMFWEELKRLNYSTNLRKIHKPDPKRACLEFICKCVKQEKKNDEIVKDLQKRYGSYGISKVTFKKWILGIKTLDKRRAKKMLGSKWLAYCADVHVGALKTPIKEESLSHESAHHVARNFSASSD